MFANYISAAIRHLLRTWLTSLINVAGLALGLASVCLISVFVYDEFSFDRFFPDYERTYRVYDYVSNPGQAPSIADAISPDVALVVNGRVEGIESITRLARSKKNLANGQVEASDFVYWADRNVFEILRLPAVAGELATALSESNAVVLSKPMAQKYFGTDSPLGQTLLMDRQYPMRVTGVFDLPPNTHLDAEIIASGAAPQSELRRLDEMPTDLSKPLVAFTYVRLTPGADSSSVAAAIDAVVGNSKGSEGGVAAHNPLIRIDRIHLHSPGTGALKMRPGGTITTILAVVIVGTLLLVAACINFINLMTAQAERRACEIGVRKAEGATRGDLAAQFIGEMIFYTALAMLIALLAVKLIFPSFELLIGRQISWSFWWDWRFLLGVPATVLLIGALAGLYPALVLSSIKPASALRGGTARGSDSSKTRQILLSFQFAVSIGLAITLFVVLLQTRYATNDALHFQKDEVLVVNGKCDHTLLEQLRLIGGVRVAGCSMQAPFANTIANVEVMPDGSEIQLHQVAVGFGFFEVYEIEPIAGRLFSEDRGTDAPSELPADTGPPIVINETAVRRYGFMSASSAIGKSIRWAQLVSINGDFTPPRLSTVVGVVSDFPMGTLEREVDPTVFYVDGSLGRRIHLKLDKERIEETLQGIDRVWREYGEPRPIDRFFFDDHIQRQYLSVLRLAAVFAAFFVMTICITLVGLVGMVTFVAESRSMEIAIRKANGAQFADILRILLWQFAKPVLWASCLAWPIAFLSTAAWLEQFSFRIGTPIWLYFGVSFAVLFVAWLIVLPQTWSISRAKPITALRHD